MILRFPQTILNNPSNLIEELEPKDRGKYFKLICPVCGRREAFIYKGDDLIVCSRKNKCGATQNLWSYIKEEHNLKDNEVLLFAYRKIGKVPSITETIPINQKLEIPKGLYFFSNSKGFIRDRAYNYLKKRRIPDKIISDLGYIYEPNSKFNNRIFIPFYEEEKLVYFIARDFTEKHPLKYLTPKGIDNNNFVYNIDKIKDEVFIFEGVFDSIMLHPQIGTAMLTNTLGVEQAKKILDKAPSRVIFVPDNDKAGERTLNRNIKLFMKYKPPSLNIEIYIFNVKGVKDFGELKQNVINLRDCRKYNKFDLTKLKWQNKSPLF